MAHPIKAKRDLSVDVPGFQPRPSAKRGGWSVGGLAQLLALPGEGSVAAAMGGVSRGASHSGQRKQLITQEYGRTQRRKCLRVAADWAPGPRGREWRAGPN